MWASVIDQACDAASVHHADVKDSIRVMAQPLETLISDALAPSVESQFLTPLESTIANVRQQLENL